MLIEAMNCFLKDLAHKYNYIYQAETPLTHSGVISPNKVMIFNTYGKLSIQLFTRQHNFGQEILLIGDSNPMEEILLDDPNLLKKCESFLSGK